MIISFCEIRKSVSSSFKKLKWSCSSTKMTDFEAIGEMEMIGVHHVISCLPFGQTCWLPGRVLFKLVGSFSCVEKPRDCLAACSKSESGCNSPSALIILVYNKAFPTPLPCHFPSLVLEARNFCSSRGSREGNSFQLPSVAAG